LYKASEYFLLEEVMSFEYRDCNTVCVTKDDFVIQYVKQIWKGDFKKMSTGILLRVFTDKDRKKGQCVLRGQFQ